jgi:hypothetical protein
MPAAELGDTGTFWRKRLEPGLNFELKLKTAPSDQPSESYQVIHSTTGSRSFDRTSDPARIIPSVGIGSIISCILDQLKTLSISINVLVYFVFTAVKITSCYVAPYSEAAGRNDDSQVRSRIWSQLRFLNPWKFGKLHRSQNLPLFPTAKMAMIAADCTIMSYLVEVRPLLSVVGSAVWSMEWRICCPKTRLDRHLDEQIWAESDNGHSFMGRFKEADRVANITWYKIFSRIAWIMLQPFNQSSPKNSILIPVSFTSRVREQDEKVIPNNFTVLLAF